MSRGRQEKRPRAQSSMIRILPARGKDGEKNNLELKLQPTDNQPRFEQKKTPCPTMPTRKRAPYPRTPTGKSTQARTEKSPLPQNADRKKRPGPNRKDPPTPERRQENTPRPEQKRPPYPTMPTGRRTGDLNARTRPDRALARPVWSRQYRYHPPPCRSAILPVRQADGKDDRPAFKRASRRACRDATVRPQASLPPLGPQLSPE